MTEGSDTAFVSLLRGSSFSDLTIMYGEDEALLAISRAVSSAPIELRTSLTSAIQWHRTRRAYEEAIINEDDDLADRMLSRMNNMVDRLYQ